LYAKLVCEDFRKSFLGRPAATLTVDLR